MSGQRALEAVVRPGRAARRPRHRGDRRRGRRARRAGRRRRAHDPALARGDRCRDPDPGPRVRRRRGGAGADGRAACRRRSSACARRGRRGARRASSSPGSSAFFVISAVWLAVLHVNGEENAAGQGHRRLRRDARRARRVRGDDGARTDLRGDALPRADVPLAVQLEGPVAGGADHGRAVRRRSRPLGAPPPTCCRSRSSACCCAGSTSGPARCTPASRCTSSTTRSRWAPTSTGAWRAVELVVGALAAVAVVLWLVRLASARWLATPATD